MNQIYKKHEELLGPKMRKWKKNQVILTTQETKDVTETDAYI